MNDVRRRLEEQSYSFSLLVFDDTDFAFVVRHWNGAGLAGMELGVVVFRCLDANWLVTGV